MGKTVIVGGLTLASGLLGFLIQWLLPVQALSDGRQWSALSSAS